jgi:CRP-like cAMP-binding protein
MPRTHHHHNDYLHDDYQHMGLFSDRSPSEVEAATNLTTRVWFDAGKRLATQRRECRQFALIIDGAVAVQRDGAHIDLLVRGDYFGEFTLLRGLPHPTTLIAQTPVTLDVVTPQEFDVTFAANPTLRERIERTCDQRIRAWARSTVTDNSPLTGSVKGQAS